jgi:DNA-binding LacI/PurR family transcriptional regulator
MLEPGYKPMSDEIHRSIRPRRSAPAAARPTLADVAARAGVTVPTVSKVLNDRDNCWASAETRSRIRAAADELGYRPNLAARGLASGRSRIIGFVSPGFGVASDRSWAVGLTEAAAREDYSVVVSSHPNDSTSEDRLILRLLDRGVDGLVIYPVDSGHHSELRRLVAAGFPVLTLEGANLLDFASDDVSVDLEAVGRLQARHLLSLGRRRICIANTLPAARVNGLRNDGIEHELAEAGALRSLPMGIEHAREGGATREEAIYAGMRAFIARHAGAFDAVASFDPVASLAVRALLDHGLRVPEDVAVIGSGNEAVARYGVVPLSSVDTHTDDGASAGFGLLLDRMRKRAARDAFRRITCRCSLVARRSTVAGAVAPLLPAFAHAP